MYVGVHTPYVFLLEVNSKGDTARGPHVMMVADYERTELISNHLLLAVLMGEHNASEISARDEITPYSQ